MAQASAEKLEDAGPAEKEGVAFHRDRERAVGKYARTFFVKRKKEQSRLSKAPDRKEAESQDERELHLEREKGDQSGSMGRKGWTPQ